MNTVKHSFRAIFGVTLSLGFMAFLLPVDAQIDAQTESFQETSEELIDEVWKLVEENYVDPTFNEQDWLEVRQEFLSRTYTSDETAYDAIREMLEQLNDLGTYFMSPTIFKAIQVDGSGTTGDIGLGFLIDKQTQEFVVRSVFENSDAFASGILPGDVLISIDNIPIEDMHINEVTVRLRGAVDTQVEIVVRQGQSLNRFSFQRANFEITPVQYRVEDTAKGKIGYIQLSQISANAAIEMRDAIQTLELQDIDGYILDLRANPGGLFYSSIDIAKMWINDGLIVSLKYRDSIEEKTAHSRALTDKPLVVLVDDGTASGAEIIASALQDRQRALLVGTSTYGRGIIQSVRSVANGAGLSFTIAQWYPPSGQDVEIAGFQPDVVVRLTKQARQRLFRERLLGTVEDPQFLKAVETLLP